MMSVSPDYFSIPVPAGMPRWVAVDLDGTLAMDGPWQGFDHIGAPVPAMVQRVKDWLADGLVVKIFTARYAAHCSVTDVVTPIEKWCQEHIGQVLPVTNAKDGAMIALWDDRAVQVIQNTGIPVNP